MLSLVSSQINKDKPIKYNVTKNEIKRIVRINIGHFRLIMTVAAGPRRNHPMIKIVCIALSLIYRRPLLYPLSQAIRHHNICILNKTNLYAQLGPYWQE